MTQMTQTSRPGPQMTQMTQTATCKRGLKPALSELKPSISGPGNAGPANEAVPFRLLLAVPLLILAIGCAEEAPSDRIRVSGHVEATEVRLAPEAGGRILTLTVQEGDRVETGQTVLTLDTRDVALAIERAKAERVAAEAQVRVVQAAARPEDVRQAESQIATAKAEQSAAQSELASADQDLERVETLLKSNSGSRKQRDDAATRRDVARDRVSAAQSRVRTAEETLARVRAGARQEDVDAARARVDVVSAQIASLEKTLGDATLKSPVAGLVTEKLVEAGEVIAPRAPAPCRCAGLSPSFARIAARESDRVARATRRRSADRRRTGSESRLQLRRLVRVPRDEGRPLHAARASPE